jgi:hypothetical protein
MIVYTTMLFKAEFPDGVVRYISPISIGTKEPFEKKDYLLIKNDVEDALLKNFGLESVEIHSVTDEEWNKGSNSKNVITVTVEVKNEND